MFNRGKIAEQLHKIFSSDWGMWLVSRGNPTVLIGSIDIGIDCSELKNKTNEEIKQLIKERFLEKLEKKLKKSHL